VYCFRSCITEPIFIISLFCLVSIPIMYVTVWFFIGRQTSDPKSGFATVEKDLPGGLTPMLGDRKVYNSGRV